MPLQRIFLSFLSEHKLLLNIAPPSHLDAERFCNCFCKTFAFASTRHKSVNSLDRVPGHFPNVCVR
nr:MAG TPA: hypothetical protein [Caudoviricetes sp.]